VTDIRGVDGEVDQYCSEYFFVAKFMAAVTSQNFLNFWNVKINKLEYMSCLP
jgi:hypothetical protein